jgi:hypothetical protein
MENFVTSSLFFELKKLLQDAGYSLAHFSLPILDDIGNASTENRLILDEPSYDTNLLSSSSEIDVNRLNNCQKNVFDSICCSVLNNEGNTFLFMDMEEQGNFFYGQPC